LTAKVNWNLLPEIVFTGLRGGSALSELAGDDV